MSSDRAWQGQSRGGGIGHAIVGGVARYAPGLMALFLLVPATWFFLFAGDARRASIDYWRRLEPRAGRWRSACRSWYHFYHFARMLADRFLVGYRADIFRCRHLGARGMCEAMHDANGCILLSAHFGNWELSGRWLSRYGDVVINIVMLVDEDPRVQAKVEAAMGEHPFNIIDLSDPSSAGLAIAAALRRGETCCMLGDRTAGDAEACNAIPFLGRRAEFPTGPFTAALVTGAPIVPTFTIKRRHGYDMIAWPAIRVRASDRNRRRRAIRAGQQRFVRYLTYHVRRDPVQWHNFYPFWDGGHTQ